MGFCDPFFLRDLSIAFVLGKAWGEVVSSRVVSHYHDIPALATRLGSLMAPTLHAPGLSYL